MENTFRINRKTIRFLRSIKGVTVGQLAAKSYISFSLLEKIENGRRKITPYANHRIVKGIASLGYTAEEIIVINMFVEGKEGSGVFETA
ncbi:helix-turn-helix domain-containing protein [Bacillus sp. XF8]|uniref:Helix-turn-helix transcriptional regulator n=1 Tax=Bacillus bingmayongensis TaxID=1150157 RepID=A0ABU5K179_9BACI|nr:helix-turn-helix transcriptional regulator [Bacillus sp. XF8]MBO1582965.1 helix-turn-helix transcriptional regulator [Bacillus sp. XF8]MDZ5609482.1 helix-turn-helix transcriptional regulator [Bacillus pseudomycoides]